MKKNDIVGTTRAGLVGTTTGSYDLYNFKPEDVKAEDIFKTLGFICRYGGRCNAFFSVAQHSLLVAQILKDEHPVHDLILGGLCHDFGEAYTGDIIRPVKCMIPGIEELESNVMDCISKAMEIGDYNNETIKLADNIALYHEAKSLGLNVYEWGFPESIKKSVLSRSAHSLLSRDMPPHAASLELMLAYDVLS